MEKVFGANEFRKPTILISTPSYDERVDIAYMLSVLDTVRLLESNGFEVDLQIPMSSALVAHTRNAIVQRFMDNNFDYLLMVDSDLGWAPEAVLKLIESNKEFCGGVYPSRDGGGFKFRPSTEEDGKIIICPETKLLKMEYIPAGFILLKRSVIEKMYDRFPELRYEPKSPNSIHSKGYCLFNTEVWEGEFWGEDYTFCRRAKEVGLEIWVDPMIPFNHAGVRGLLMNVLTTDKKFSEPNDIADSPGTFKFTNDEQQELMYTAYE